MLQTITSLDLQMLLWIQQNLQSPTLTSFLECMTDLGNAGIVWIAIAAILWVNSRTRWVGIAVFLAIALDVVVTNGILKPLIARPRPFLLDLSITPLITPPTGFSFPSGHSVSSFAAAFVLYRLLPKGYGIPAITLAVLISLSRIYLGVHYPSDILAGLLLGFAIAKVVLWLMQKTEFLYWFFTKTFQVVPRRKE